MAAATKTITELTTLPITQQSFYDALKAAFINAGFSATPFDEYNAANGTKNLVYEIVHDSLKTKGKSYFMVSLTTGLALGTLLYTTWDKVAHTGTGHQPIGLGVSAFVIYGTTVVMQFTAFNHAEFKGVHVRQSAIHNIIGSIRPATKPEWFNENQYCYSFGLRDTSFKNLNGFGSADNPIGSTDANFASLGDNAVYTLGPWTPKLGYENQFTLKRDVLPGPYIFFPSQTINDPVSRGIAGKFSDDIVLVAASGLQFMDVIKVSPTEEYTLFGPGAPGVAIRTL